TATSEGKINFLQDFVQLMANTQSPIQRDVYISKICREMEVDRQSVTTQLDSVLKRKKSAQSKKEAKILRPYTEGSPLSRGDFQRQKFPKEAIAAERLIAYLIKNPDRLGWVQQSITEEMIVSPIDLDIYRAVCDRITTGLVPDMMSLCAVLTQDRADRLSEIISVDGGQNIGDAAAEDYIKALKSHTEAKKPEEFGKLGDEELERYITSLSQSKK
ncbi:MAG: hypothetical protein RRY54_06185, partial [Angelakisella sp.]